jgi:DNA-binding transcriptional ArsR family regulator
VDPEMLAGLRSLVDLGRIQVLAAVARRPRTVAEIAEVVGMPAPAVGRQLDSLVQSGLVEVRAGTARAEGAEGAGRRADDARYFARADRVGTLARHLAELERAAGARAPNPWSAAATVGEDGEDGEPPAERSVEAAAARIAATSPEEAKVLRSFIREGRLVGIPAQPKKRLVILRYLRELVFTEDREYPEKEVNQRLGLLHPDVASLRRYLVDEGLVTRAAGLYRRVP